MVKLFLADNNFQEKVRTLLFAWILNTPYDSTQGILGNVQRSEFEDHLLILDLVNC